MNHPDIVVEFNTRVAPASHRGKPTYKENSVPEIKRQKQVKKSTLKSFQRRASEGNNAKNQNRGQQHVSIEYPTSVETEE